MCGCMCVCEDSKQSPCGAVCALKMRHSYGVSDFPGKFSLPGSENN